MKVVHAVVSKTEAVRIPHRPDIPEDPQTAEMYYNQDGFESCSEDEETEEVEDKEKGEEGTDNFTPSEHFYQTDSEDNDLQVMMKHMENVLEGEFSGALEAEVKSPHSPREAAVINGSLVETRIRRMRESVSHRLGAEVFQKLYDYLKAARERKESEAIIREDLSSLVERPSDGFQVDQLLYYEEQLQEAKQQGATTV